MELLPVVALVGGTVCLYGAIKNKNPLGILTAALTGKDLASVPPLMSDSAGPGLADGSKTTAPGAIPLDDVNNGLPPGDPGRQAPPPIWNNPLIPDWLENRPNTGVAPVLPGEGSPGNGAI